MKRNLVFMFRVTNDERLVITTLAQKLQRTQSDMVRFVILNAARALEENNNNFQSLENRLTPKNLDSCLEIKYEQ